MRCSLLSVLRSFSYADQVSPSNTSDLMDLFVRGPVAALPGVRDQRGCNLTHQILVLQDVQAFLLSFPIFRADHDKVGTGTPSHLERFMIAGHFLDHRFQVVSETIYADGIHNAPLSCTEIPYNFREYLTPVQ